MPQVASTTGWMLIFLAPVFMQRLFIGGEALSYDELSGVPLTALGYLSHVLILVGYIGRQASLTVSRRHFLQFAGLCAVSAIHAAFLIVEQPVGFDNAVLAMARQLVWILACLAILGMSTPEDLLQKLVDFTHFSFAIVVVTYTLYLTTGLTLQILLSGGMPRAQALLSEPSGFGCLLAGYVGLAVHLKKWRRLMAAAVVAFMAYSVIGILGFLVGLVTGLGSRSITSPRGRFMLSAFLILLMPIMLVVLPLAAEPISKFAHTMLVTFSGTSLEAFPLYQGFGQRILEAASMLDTGVKNVSAGDNLSGGGLFRFTSVLLLLQQLVQSGHIWFGYGIGAHSQLMLANNESLLDFGLFPLLISSFGIAGTVVVFGWLVMVLGKARGALASYAVPFTVIACINSAGGIHMYSVVLVAALFLERLDRGRLQPGIPLRQHFSGSQPSLPATASPTAEVGDAT